MEEKKVVNIEEIKEKTKLSEKAKKTFKIVGMVTAGVVVAVVGALLIIGKHSSESDGEDGESDGVISDVPFEVSSDLSE